MECRKNEKDEKILIATADIPNIMRYAQKFGFHDGATEFLFSRRNRKIAKALFANELCRLPDDLVEKLIETRCSENIAAYFAHSPLGLVNEYKLAQSKNKTLIIEYSRRWGFSSIMARHFLTDNHLLVMM